MHLIWDLASDTRVLNGSDIFKPSENKTIVFGNTAIKNTRACFQES